MHRMIAGALTSVIVLALESTTLGQSFQLPPPASTLVAGHRFVAADFDADGWKDLLIGQEVTFGVPEQVAVHRNLSFVTPGLFGAGSFYTASSLSLGGTVVAVSDVDGDGRTDFVIARGTLGATCHTQGLELFVNSTSSPGLLSFTPLAAQPLTYAATGAVFDEFLPPVGLELAVTDSCASLVRIYRYSALLTPAFTELSTEPVGPTPSSLWAGDVDGDGDADLVSGNSVDCTVLYNDGLGGFSGQSVGVPAARGAAVADVDGNGLMDLVASDGFVVRLARQVVAGAFVPTDLNLTASGCCLTPGDVALGNVDGDGYPDLLVARGLGAGQTDTIVVLNSGSAPYFMGGVVANTGTSGTAALALVELDGVPGDDVVRVARSLGSPASLEIWSNLTPQLSAPYPGSGGDLQLLTTVAGVTPGPSLPGNPIKHVVPGDFVSIMLTSPGGTLIGNTPLIAAQVFTTGSPPIPTLPSLSVHFNLLQPIFYLFSGFDVPLPPGLGEVGLPPGGVGVGFEVLPGIPSGFSLLIQGLTFPVSVLATSDGHELRF